MRCPRCDGPLSTDVGADEDYDGQVVEVAVCGCGWERQTQPLGRREVAAWVRRRLAVVRQRRAAS